MFDDVIESKWENFEAAFEEALKDVDEIESIEQFIEILDKYLEKM